MLKQLSARRRVTRNLAICLAASLGAITAPAALAQMVNWAPGPGEVAYEDRAAGDTYIVLHQADPLALYAGDIDGLVATTPRLRGERRLDVHSADAVAYLGFLDAQHDALITAAEAALGRDLTIRRRLRYALSGFTAVMSPEEARVVASLPGVRRVEAGVALTLQTDNGPAWIGADGAYDGTGTYDGIGTRGEGIIVGVIDSGVNHDHPSFAATGPVDGYVHENPLTDPITGLPTYVGACDPVTGQPFCNDKLIGVWDFTGTTPHDDNGHGSHTASTTAGNVVDAVLSAPTIDLDRRISGVAPHANIISYKGCITTPAIGTCLTPETDAAIDQAVADGVDVINFSIGGPAGDPWSDSGALGFLAAQAAGIFVATSAGNDGPKAATLGSPADAPWLTSVAASTHDRSLGNRLIGMAGGQSAPPADIAGKSLTSALPETRIVYAGDYGDPLCQTPYTAGTFNGEIVVCDRGINARVEKAENVEAGGAGGFVLANDSANGNSLVADGYVIPGVHITYDDGVVLKAWLADGGDDHVAQIEGTTAVAARENGDVMAGFSSRGQNPSAPGLVKPDITAPGVDILAAVLTDLTNPSTSPEYGVISGTSMSSPHTAGAAALIRALQPDWTPDQVKSALMTTAYVVRGKTGTDGLVKEDGVTPADALDLGAGRVDLTQAARAGFLMSEIEANYTAADPAAGGDPTALNLPSLGHGNCLGSCSWTRTLTGAVATDWTVSVSSPDGLPVTVEPTSFSLGAGEDITLSVTADVEGLQINRWAFADLVFTPADAAIPVAHLPMAVRIGPIPETRSFDITTYQGSVTIEDFVSQIDIASFTPTISGMQRGLTTERTMTQDPTVLDPYDGPHSGPDDPDPAAGTFFVLVDVPEPGGKLLDTRISETTSADMDLFVGKDNNGDGLPDEGEELCAAATAAALEQCTLVAPEAGTYWILVQNWLTGSGADAVTLSTTVIPAEDLGNLTATAPSPVGAGEPFDITLAWSESDFEVGDTWVGLVEVNSGSSSVTDVAIMVVEFNVTDLTDTPPDGEPTPGDDPADRNPPTGSGGALGWATLFALLGAFLRRRRV